MTTHPSARLERFATRRLRREYERYHALDLRPSLEALEMTTGPISRVTAEAANEHYNEQDAYDFLDPETLSYTAAYYGDTPEEAAASERTLAQAQIAKFDLVIERAEIENGQRILVPGCGFSGFERHLLRRFPEVQVTSTAWSEAQVRRILRFKSDGSDPLSSPRHVLLTSRFEHLDQALPAESFDRVVTIGVHEHISNVDAWCAIVRRRLAAGGLYFMQVIASRDYLPFLLKAEDTETSEYFPGGMIRPVWSWRNDFGGLTFERSWFLVGTNYHRTLEAWEAQFDRLPETDRADHWRRYFALCKAMFSVPEAYGNIHCTYRR